MTGAAACGPPPGYLLAGPSGPVSLAYLVLCVRHPSA
jgi:hypothetical protein